MSSNNTDQFYTDLSLYEIAVNKLLAKTEVFEEVPDDWQIIITDIKGSTQAVKDGLHQEVNLIATGTIIAALNIAWTYNISIPFFFGGDGATLLVPSSLLNPIMQALNEHRRNSATLFDLPLRVGHVPVKEVYQNGRHLSIAKVKISDIYSIPVVLGNGLRYAESLIKGPDFNEYIPNLPNSMLDLEGMECRWDKIEPPKNSNEIVCLLVDVQNEDKHATVFKQVLDQVDAIYGSQSDRNPISVPKLKLQATIGKVSREMRIKIGRFDLSYLIKNWLGTLFGKLYFRHYESGQAYLQTLVALSDTLVLDGRINTVISGTAKQRALLVQALDDIEKQGHMKYGLHVSPKSVLSCYVRDRQDQHIHFVDGAEGGYTKAAGVLKQKLRTLS